MGRSKKKKISNESKTDVEMCLHTEKKKSGLAYDENIGDPDAFHVVYECRACRKVLIDWENYVKVSLNPLPNGCREWEGKA